MNEVLIANILMIIGEGILFVASSRKSKKQMWSDFVAHNPELVNN